LQQAPPQQSRPPLQQAPPQQSRPLVQQAPPQQSRPLVPQSKPPPQQPPPQQSKPIEEWASIGYPGNDVAGGPIKNKDECKKKCLANPSCNGATYASNHEGKGPWCWQKSILAGKGIKNEKDRLTWSKPKR
jgi:hypothetical protein